MIYHEHKSAYVIIGEVHVIKNTVSEPKILFLHVEVKKKKKKKARPTGTGICKMIHEKIIKTYFSSPSLLPCLPCDNRKA